MIIYLAKLSILSAYPLNANSKYGRDEKDLNCAAIQVFEISD
jgi:hypothetical protein